MDECAPVEGINDVRYIKTGFGVRLAVKNDGSEWDVGNDVIVLSKDGLVWQSEVEENENNVHTKGILVQGLSDVKEISVRNKVFGLITEYQYKGIKPDFKEEYKSGTNRKFIALKNDGTVWQWGLFDDIYCSKPIKVEGILDVKNIGALENQISAIKNNGSLLTWGKISNLEYNEFGLIARVNYPRFRFRLLYLEIDPGRNTVPVVVNNRTFLPIRALIENIGGSVEWQEESNTICIKLWNKDVKMTVGKTQAFVNNNSFEMDTAPMVINDRTMLPIRFCGEALGFSVEWIEPDERQDGTVKLFYNGII